MRLGELLRQKGLLTPEQLRVALHEQSRFGGRLGSNLLHLGYLEMDAVALALSDQQKLPPVLREHVAAVDKKILGLFPASLVLAHKAIPIGYTLTKPGRVVVACVDPAKLPLEELAFAAGRRIEPWIAPESLVQECLEKYFGAPAAPLRYVSVKLAARERSSPRELRAAGADEAKPLATAPALAAPEPPRKAKSGSVKPSARSGRRGLSPPPAPPASVPNAARTLEMPEMPAPGAPLPTTAASLDLELPRPSPMVSATEPEPGPPAAEPALASGAWRVSDSEAPDEAWDIPDDPDDAPRPQQPLTAPPDALRPVIDLNEASRMLEMATSKEQIGQVLEDWLRSSFGCGLVLVVKGDMAIGWKGFFPDAEDLVEAVAIALGKPSMFGAAYESRTPFRGAPPAEGAKLQDRLWKLLRCAPPADALVCPVVLGKRVVNLLYAHMDDGGTIAPSVAEEASVLARGAAAAYARMIGKKRS